MRTPRARAINWSPCIAIVPPTTSDAVTTCPTLMVEARLSTALDGSCNRSNACRRSSRSITTSPLLDQHLAQQDGGAFAHPAETRVLGGVIEWQDDDRRALRGLRADHRRRRKRDRDQAREEARQRHATSMASSGRGPRTVMARLHAPG